MIKYLNCTLAIDASESITDEELLKSTEQILPGTTLTKKNGGAIIDDIADMKWQDDLHKKENGDG